ncbi:MAG: tol-pal system protein YbgF [Sulfuricaulis sp.]
MRDYRRIGVQAGGMLVAGLLFPAVMAAGTLAAGRDLPPVIEMGVDNAPATPLSPAREALADLLQQLETQQAELRRLRGQVEVQGNEIERLKARERDLLADLDRRISALEHGKAAAVTPSGSATGTTAAIVSTSPSPVGAPVAAQEQQDYDAAFDLLKQGHYERATKGFNDFLSKYPQSSLRDNARYWLGQAYYVVRNFRHAIAEFSKLAGNHPNSAKAPDASLKIGYSHYELGEWSQARDSFKQVIARYPGTPAAASAVQRLAKLKQEKH